MSTLSTATPSDSRCPARLPLKQRGRKDVSDELRARCFARIRENRQQLLERLRDASDRQDGSCDGGLRAVARQVVDSELGDSAKNADSTEFDIDVDTLLAIEEELRRELELAEVCRGAEEVENFLAEQNEADCELYEQHVLGGVPCPLCGRGRLDNGDSGLLRCSNCKEMQVQLMDEMMHIDDVCEILGFAEESHRNAGCRERPYFKVCSDCGPSVLYLCCGHVR